MTFRSSKRQTKAEQLVAAMSDGGWHHMRELNGITFRYGARFFELRERGWITEKRSVGEDEFEYRLIAPNKQLELV